MTEDFFISTILNDKRFDKIPEVVLVPEVNTSITNYSYDWIPKSELANYKANDYRRNDYDYSWGGLLGWDSRYTTPGVREAARKLATSDKPGAYFIYLIWKHIDNVAPDEYVANLINRFCAKAMIQRADKLDAKIKHTLPLMTDERVNKFFEENCLDDDSNSYQCLYEFMVKYAEELAEHTVILKRTE